MKSVEYNEDDDFCLWEYEVGKYITDCNHAYFPFLNYPDKPIIEKDICPWCNRKIKYKYDGEDE